MEPSTATGDSVTSSRSTSWVRRSIGRAPVSKTGGCRFDSCRACKYYNELHARALTPERSGLSVRWDQAL